MKKLLILPLLAMMASCATQNLYLNVIQPAPVTLATEIKNVAIIDRSTPSDQVRSFDNLDKILTLEGASLDSIGTREAIKGVSGALAANDRFHSVRLLSEVGLTSSAPGGMPPPLSPAQVAEICHEHGTEALFALEHYDTDTRISYATEPAKVKTPLGGLPALMHTASMETVVKTGWRIYSPADQAVIDEYLDVESVRFSGRGITPAAAIAGFVNRKAAVMEVSRKAGEAFAMRLIPYRLRVTREYFVRGSDNFRVARRRAQLGNWDDAAELWQTETSNPKRKVAGRAHYNMAIISEINGDLPAATAWAHKAYSDYHIKNALHYSRILEKRKNNEELLRYQEQR